MSKFFEKRIGFIISNWNLIPHGGVGTFAKGFCEMAAANNWVVDIIMDAPPQNFPEWLASLKVGEIVYPPEPLKYSSYQQHAAFSESIPFERMLNVNTALMRAHQTRLYDFFVANAPTEMLALYALGITDLVPTALYNHIPEMTDLGPARGLFSKEYLNVFRKLCTLPSIYNIAPNAEMAQKMVDANIGPVCILPLLFDEEALFEPADEKKKSGVLFIGRWDERKDPTAYLDVISKTKLPAKVLASKKAERKFREEFEKRGIKNFEIKTGLSSLEKVKFIQSAKVYYSSAVSETYCYGLAENIGNHVVCHDYDWTKWFDGFPNVHRVKKNEAAKIVTQLYATKADPQGVVKLKEIANKARNDWVSFIKAHPVKGCDTRGEILKRDDFWYAAFVRDLDREVGYEDIQVAYKARSVFKAKHNNTGTWLSRTGAEPKIFESDDAGDFLFG